MNEKYLRLITQSYTRDYHVKRDWCKFLFISKFNLLCNRITVGTVGIHRVYHLRWMYEHLMMYKFCRDKMMASKAGKKSKNAYRWNDFNRPTCVSERSRDVLLLTRTLPNNPPPLDRGGKFDKEPVCPLSPILIHLLTHNSKFVMESVFVMYLLIARNSILNPKSVIVNSESFPVNRSQ